MPSKAKQIIVGRVIFTVPRCKYVSQRVMSDTTKDMIAIVISILRRAIELTLPNKFWFELVALHFYYRVIDYFTFIIILLCNRMDFVFCLWFVI